jgi:hypothetical protein
VLHSNFGCCIGTIQKSATYNISGALERRVVPIGELVENKRQQLKRKTGARSLRLRRSSTSPNYSATHRGPSKRNTACAVGGLESSPCGEARGGWACGAGACIHVAATGE